jgi:hypothetical protein
VGTGGKAECGASADGDGGNASHSAHLLERIRRRGIVSATEPLPQPPSTPRGSAKPRTPLAGLAFLRALQVLDDRLRCPRCGSRYVPVLFDPPLNQAIRR